MCSDQRERDDAGAEGEDARDDAGDDGVLREHGGTPLVVGGGVGVGG